jgi:hypothetical protein
MSDLERLLRQVEELKKLATKPDDSWMDSMSTEELRALGKRVRKVADGLSGLQGQLRGQVPSNPIKPVISRRAGSSGSLGNMVRRDQAWPAQVPSNPIKPAISRRAASSGSLGDMVRRDQASPAPRPEPEGVDLSNPMRRRRPNL